jgi:Family of unknown function (DUF6058)
VHTQQGDGDEDTAYLASSFVSLDSLALAHGRDFDSVRSAIAAGLLPQPAYRLADGTELVAPDFFALADAAGADDALPDWFTLTYGRIAAGVSAADPPDVAWSDYLSGGYGVCLRSVTPATIVRKAVLIDSIERLLDNPQERDNGWRTRLREGVDALDVLERSFAAVDRLAGPTSRDLLITDVRMRYPDIWTPSDPPSSRGR